MCPALAATVLTVACGNHTLKGTVTLISADGISRSGDSCQGTGGFDDIAGGAPVVVKDGSGKIIASTNLGPGAGPSGQYSNVECTFEFSADVPDTDFYQVAVGHRNAVTNSKAELEKNGWKIDLSLSSS